MKQVENDTLDDLSGVTKNLGARLLDLYDEAATGINDNKTENLAKQVEIENLVQENNNLRHEVNLMVNTIEKLENFLGVRPTDRFALNN
jgi:hypothetical protein